MLVHSFMRQGYDLVPVEVELSLLPGLPQITFLGLPDAMIRESVGRIKSALRQQGFEVPGTSQVLVHLKPTYLKKSSRGLDLAVAAALLWETGQVPKPDAVPVVYGELTLKGEVTVPDDLDDGLDWSDDRPILSGQVAAELPFATLQVKELKDLAAPQFVRGAGGPPRCERPSLGDLAFPPPAARLAEIVACGEHSCLLAGPPGSGKTTWAEAVPAILAEPDSESFRLLRRISRGFAHEISWRPVVQPHHSITPLAMLGGGGTPRPGEITRAHGGVLIMDEFLEFASSIQEALREPVESGRIHIARGGASRAYPAEFLLIATTNLCPCGKFVPRRGNRCRCPVTRRSRYLARLSGPFADRFALLALTDAWSKSRGDVAVTEVLARVERARAFRAERGQKLVNARLGESALRAGLAAPADLERVSIDLASRRRGLALLRVARSIADLECSEQVRLRHLEEAREHAVTSFDSLESVLG